MNYKTKLLRRGGNIKKYQHPSDAIDVGTHNRQMRTNELQSTPQLDEFTDFVYYNPFELSFKTVYDENGNAYEIGPSEDYLQRVNENRMHQAAARGLWNSAWNGVPSIPDMAKAAYHYWMGNPYLGGNSELPIEPNIGYPPEIGISVNAFGSTAPKFVKAGEEVKGIKVSAETKRATRAANMKENKVQGISRKGKVATQTKQGQAWSTGDARHVNSGQSRVKNQQIERAIERIKNNYSSTQFYKDLEKIEKKLAKCTNEQRLKELRQERRQLALAFIEAYGHG